MNKTKICKSILVSLEAEHIQGSERTDDTNIGAEQNRKQKQAESLGYDTRQDRPKWVLSPGNPDEKKGRREQRRRELLMLWEAPPMVPPKGIHYIFSSYIFFIFSFDSTWLEEKWDLLIDDIQHKRISGLL